jgi:hypothetical protein
VKYIPNCSWLRRGVCAALVLLAVPLATPDASAAPAASPASAPAQLEPKALELLKAASARLAASRSMSFTATVSYESPSALGPALVYSTRSDVTMQRPNRLRVITPGDGPANEFYYDGKTMTAYARDENLVASAAAPATIDAALEQAFNNAAIYFPFTDLIVADPYKDLAEGLKVAFYIGRSTVVAGTATDMVAFGNDAVFAQIWIGVDDKLPRKLRAVYLNDPAHLRHDMQISNWKLDGQVAADAFEPKLVAGATHIAFARPDMMPAGAAARPPMTAPGQPKPADHP